MRTRVRDHERTPRPDLEPLDAGRALAPATRQFFEHRFGADLADVRVHTGPPAAANAQRLRAEAYTVGRHIVFAGGRYQPSTPRGIDLLAHEIAHTVQQRGAPAGLPSTDVGAAPTSTEHQADRAAALALRGPPERGAAAAALSRTSRPQVARRPIAWQTMPEVELPDGQKVDQRENYRPGVARFMVPLLPLPAEKGPVLDRYVAAANAQALEATLCFPAGGGGALRTGLWQSRAEPPDLRRRWFAKVGWPAADAARLWNEKGGQPNWRAPNERPRVAGTTCDTDHVIELQLGGTNVPSNLMMLDSGPNQASGNAIWQTVSGMARRLRDSVPAGPAAGPTEVILTFQGARQVGGPVAAPSGCAGPGAATSCVHVDCCATAAGAGAAAAAGTELYPIVAGAVQATFQVPPGNAAVGLLADERNVQSAEAVPGVVLESLNRAATHGIDGFIESTRHFKRSKTTRVPIILSEEAAAVSFTLVTEGATRRLRLVPGRAALEYQYPYLSRGRLTPTFTDRGLEATGTLTPSLPLLNRARIDVRLADGVFEGRASIDPSKLRLGPLRATEADLTVSLAPELAVTGGFAFEIGSLARGRMTARVDPAAGFVAEGTVEALIPGLDEARGTVTYRDGRLTGLVVVRTEQLSRLPGSPQGELQIAFDDQGVHPTGEITVTLPGGNVVRLGVRGAGGRYRFTGQSTFDLPGLQPLTVQVSYDGEHFTASGTTGITYGGLTGNVTLRYRDGGFSGSGDATLQRGRVTGTVHIEISSGGNLYGTGRVRVELARGVAASVGVVKPQQGPLRIDGQLELPPVIQIFARMGGATEFPFPRLRIPIIGVSVGVTSVGLVAVIGGAMGFSYGVGAGTINDARVGVGFNPLEENTDFELRAQAELRVPATVTAFVRVEAGVALDAAVASVRGQLSVQASLGIEGGITMPFDLHYHAGMFEVTTELRAEATPFLELRFLASIVAEALRETFVERWDWELGRFRWGSGFRVAMIFPFHYQSGTPFQLPRASDIRFEYPPLDFDRLMPALARAAGG